MVFQFACVCRAASTQLVTPIKKLLPTHIKPGSPFELAVQGVDVSKAATRELRTALLRMSVKL